jgi:ParB-like chromosome segregation protein Spo0J
MGAHVDDADINEALKQVEARLNDNPSDMESKLARLELKVVELARMLDAALDAGNGGAPQAAAAHEEKQAMDQAPRQGIKKVKKLQQNPATGVIEEVEVDDSPSDHFIVADGRGRFTAKDLAQHKKSVFIAARDDEPVNAAKK